jgi:N-acetyl-1-D-myo-inositol-2-amino-2-deoxy-alpha-D-glucopyranoside deacetylase
VTAAHVLRDEWTALAADPRARTLADDAGLTFPGAHETLPPVARDGDVLAEASATGRLVDVEVEPVLPAVVAAMRAHATQIQHATAARDPEGRFVGWYALSNGVLAPIGPTETYLVADDADARPPSVGSAR